MFLRYVSLVVFLLICVPFAFGAELEIDIDEQGKVTSFYDDYFITQVNGTVTLTNPTDADLYNVEIPFFIDTLTLITDNTTEAGDNYISQDQIFLINLEANSSLTFEYELIGITTTNPNPGGEGVLYYAIASRTPRIYSNIIGSLYKAPLEIPERGGRNSTRLVSVHIVNPTAFTFNVDLVKVIKTSDLDPNNELDSWDFSADLTQLNRYQTVKFDLLDTNATEGEIYWLQSDVYFDEIDLQSDTNVSAFTQDDLFELLENDTIISENLTGDALLDRRLFVRKLVDRTLVLPGQTQNITLIVNNFGNSQILAELEDSIPEGFTINSADDETASINEDEIEWTIEVNGRSAKRFQYEVTFDDAESVGVDYFDPALLTFGSQKIYSRSVPFVRQYVPERKVYIQKSLDFRPNGDVQVLISVRNLGESTLSGLVVREYLGADNEFKEITKPFTEKGVWRIETLAPNEIWETSYVTDKTNVLNSFPDIFGVPRASVFQNIILKNVVESTFTILDVSTVEIGGVVALLLGLVAYLLPNSFLVAMKRRLVKDLRLTSHELHSLKQSTTPTQHSSSSQSIAPNQSPEARRIEKSEHDKYREARQQQIDQTQAILDKIKQDIDNKT